jgi:hypothetical protein
MAKYRLLRAAIVICNGNTAARRFAAGSIIEVERDRRPEATWQPLDYSALTAVAAANREETT